jgi:hypothetical protein
MASLEITANPCELQIHKTQIVPTSGNMGTQPQNPMFGRRDAGNPDRVRIFSNNRTLERQVGNLAWLELNESSSEVVGLATERPICVILLSRPFHGC